MPISEKAEIVEVECAAASRHAPIRMHIERSIELLADRKAPDYRNSIKESISAVEAACKLIAKNPKADLDKALAVLSKQHKVHGAFKSAVQRLYAYTSDEGGVRHALMDEPSVDQADARFMMVVCSAFCNFLLARAAAHA